MSAATYRILTGIFLVAHGLIHYSLTPVPVPAPGALRTPYWPAWWRSAVDPLWPASRMGMSPGMAQTFGSILWVLTLAGFALAGLALIVLPDQAILWQAPAVVGSVASLVLLAFFWHPWLVLGVVIDLGVLAALALGWPPAIFIH